MKAGTAGGIEAVVKAIDTHIDSADACKYGFGALLEIITNNCNNNEALNNGLQPTNS